MSIHLQSLNSACNTYLEMHQTKNKSIRRSRNTWKRVTWGSLAFVSCFGGTVNLAYAFSASRVISTQSRCRGYSGDGGLGLSFSNVRNKTCLHLMSSHREGIRNHGRSKFLFWPICFFGKLAFFVLLWSIIKMIISTSMIRVKNFFLLR